MKLLIRRSSRPRQAQPSWLPRAVGSRGDGPAWRREHTAAFPYLLKTKRPGRTLIPGGVGRRPCQRQILTEHRLKSTVFGNSTLLRLAMIELLTVDEAAAA